MPAACVSGCAEGATTAARTCMRQTPLLQSRRADYLTGRATYLPHSFDRMAYAFLTNKTDAFQNVIFQALLRHPVTAEIFKAALEVGVGGAWGVSSAWGRMWLHVGCMGLHRTAWGCIGPRGAARAHTEGHDYQTSCNKALGAWCVMDGPAYTHWRN